MNSVVIAVGSNINPEEYVLRAGREVSTLGILFKKSYFVYTKPLLYKAQNDFYNGIFFLLTKYTFDELFQLLKNIESKLDRVRTENKNGPRTIDLDIVIFNGQILDKDVFIRDFIRKPLIELLPRFAPVLHVQNYKKYFEQTKQVLDVILNLLPVRPAAILGFGDWFSDREPVNKTIDLAIVSCIDLSAYKIPIMQELYEQNVSSIESNVFELYFLALGQTALNKIIGNKNFFSEYSKFKLLYGSLDVS